CAPPCDGGPPRNPAACPSPLSWAATPLLVHRQQRRAAPVASGRPPDPEASSTSRPGTGRALGLAGGTSPGRSVGPRPVRSFPTADRPGEGTPISESETACACGG